MILDASNGTESWYSLSLHISKQVHKQSLEDLEVIQLLNGTNFSVNGTSGLQVQQHLQVILMQTVV